MAHFGPHAMSMLSPLLDEQRTTCARYELSEFDPYRSIGRQTVLLCTTLRLLNVIGLWSSV